MRIRKEEGSETLFGRWLVQALLKALRILCVVSGSGRLSSHEM
jgi:hypothetical protein